MVTGGGSGGHITPLLAVASELKRLEPAAHIVYIGQRGDRLGRVVAEHGAIDGTTFIWAGKFRRYHGEGWRQLLDLKTWLFNIRDAFLFGLGTIESIWKIAKLKPDVVFIKGGFVGVPVGLAAALWRIPYITHDSDALPGLANRLIARWARVHAVGLPAEVYSYPKDKTVTVGVPVVDKFKKVNTSDQVAYKQAIGLADAEQIVFITGGGLGAQRLNMAMVAIASKLLGNFPGLHIVHATGHKNHATVDSAYAAVLPTKDQKRLHTMDYVQDLYRYSGAADVVVARAGATNMAELAVQAKASIVVPNPTLTGGHQIHNALTYEQAHAAKVIKEMELQKTPDVLYTTLAELLSSEKTRKALGEALHGLAHQNAAGDLAKLLIEQGKAG